MPRKNKEWNVAKPNMKQCQVCGATGAKRIDIKISWFRGDDVVLWVCKEHRKDEKALLELPQAKRQLEKLK